MNTPQQRTAHNTSHSPASVADGLSARIDGQTHVASQALEDLAHDAEHLTQRGNAALHRQADQIGHQARRAQHATQVYIQAQPLRAIAYAAAAGAAVVLLTKLLMRGSR